MIMIKAKKEKNRETDAWLNINRKKKKNKKRLNSKKEVKNELFSMLKCTIG